MAAPTLHAQGTIATGVQTGAPSVTIPTHQANDILVVVAMTWAPNTSAAMVQIPTPSGWTLLGTQVKLPTAAATADGWVAAFWRRATAAGTTVTLTRDAGWDTGPDCCFNARAYVIRGAKLSGNPWDATASAGGYTAANQAFPALTVSGTERTAIIFGGASDNLAFSMAATGWTIGTEANDAGGTDSAFQTARQENVSSNTAASTSTVTAPAAGGYGFIGVSFAPDLTALLSASVTLTLTTPATILTTEKLLSGAATIALTTNTPVLQQEGFGTLAFGEYAFGGPTGGPPPAGVTVVGTPSQAAGASTSSLTFSHTVSATTTGLFVGVVNQSPQLVTSVTFNGVALTQLWIVGDSIPIQVCAGYLLLLPDVTTANVVVTFAGSVDAGWAGAVNLANLETASLAAAHRTSYTLNDGGGAPPGPSITVVDSQAGDLVIDCAVTFAATINVDASQTSVVEDDAIGGGSTSGGISTELATGASTVMAWSSPVGGSYWAVGATALVAAGGAAPGAEFEADIALAVTTSAALTTQKLLAASPTLAFATTASLTTEKRLEAAVTVALTAVAPLTTQKLLDATASLAVTSTAALTTQKLLAATPSMSLVTAAALTTEIRLAGASMVAVTSAASLEAGAGLQAAASLAVTTAAILTTEKRLAATSTIAVTTAVTLTAGVGFQGAATIEIAVTDATMEGGADLLAADALLEVTTAASLTTEIRLAAGATLAVTSSASLTTEKRLAGAGILAVTTLADLATGVSLSGAATVRLTTAADLTLGAGLQAAATLQITTGAHLTTTVALAGAATVGVTTAATLSTILGISGHAAITVTAAAALTATPALAGTAQLVILTAADLTAALDLAGQALIAIDAGAVLGTVPPFIIRPSVRPIGRTRTTDPVGGRGVSVVPAGRTVTTNGTSRTSTPVSAGPRTTKEP